MERNLEKGLSTSKGVMVINGLLALVKVAAGVLGNSYALVADGIESTLDVASSFIVWVGLRVSVRPADDDHPYGHGKAESIAALVVCLFLMAAACGIAYHSIRELLVPQGMPAPYTLVVLVAVVALKEYLFRRVQGVGLELGSSALQSDAWHHRSDALTSLAAFVGISIALLGGERFAAADDWAALLACGVIFWNGIRLARLPLDEVMDAAVPQEVEQRIREIAEGVEDVHYVEKCRARKSGTAYLVDLHITVAGDMTVAEGHDVAHQVSDRLKAGASPQIIDVAVHVEPDCLGKPPSPRDIYRDHADRYDELVRAEDCHGNLWSSLCQLVDWNDAAVVEAGVGTGRVTKLFIDSVQRATCCDRSAHMLAFARRVLAEHHNKIRFLEADNLDLPQLDASADVFIEGWSFGHAVSGCESQEQVRLTTERLLQSVRRNLRDRGTAILIETQGTNTEGAGPPSDNLQSFYELLEREYGFSVDIIRTDYEFSTNEDAVRVMGFFFGEEMAASVRARGATVIPEWTGIWSKRF